MTVTLIPHADDHMSVQCPHCDQSICGEYQPGWRRGTAHPLICERAEREWDHIDECAKQNRDAR